MFLMNTSIFHYNLQSIYMYASFLVQTIHKACYKISHTSYHSITATLSDTAPTHTHSNLQQQSVSDEHINLHKGLIAYE